jgi:SAM-dependent MidA family methyltransferase
VTAAGELLRDEITRRGPIPFRRFMETALYHPEHGYYMRPRDPFGKAGDFYTAEQVQPVFGRLVASAIRGLAEGEEDPDFTVVELGAGREEMKPHFAAWRYVPLDVSRGRRPDQFRGVAFANEFFDALPVDVVIRRGARFLERHVAWNGERFVWIDGDCVAADVAADLERYGAPTADGGVVEVNREARRVLGELSASLASGWLLAIDYGYAAREIDRFPAGTLMSYRRHQALEDVLRNPGEQDITAHVNFTALAGYAVECGFEVLRTESMGRMLLREGERDNFGAALEAGGEHEAQRYRLQLKTLLYGMGETFRVMLARKRS